jgi:lysophospholipase L1-like esterase
MVARTLLSAFAALVATTAAQQGGSSIKYMPFGDSITEITCWRALLWHQLQNDGYTNVDFVGSNSNDFNCNDGSYDRQSEGHSGYLAYNIAQQNQLDGWLSQNPADIITMHLGTNDITSRKSTDDIISSFTSLVSTMRKHNANMKIIVSAHEMDQPFPSSSTNRYQVAQIIPYTYSNAFDSAISSLNSAIPSWAQGLNSTESPIWVVDMNSAVSGSDLRDGIHPNSNGDQKMEAVWYPAMVNAINLMSGGGEATTTTSAVSTTFETSVIPSSTDAGGC